MNRVRTPPLALVAVLAAMPFAFVACDLGKKKEGEDASATAPATTTAAATTAAVDTTQPLPIAPSSSPSHPVGPQPVKLPDGGWAMPDGAAWTVPTMPSNLTLPSGFPSSLPVPSGFPTTLPSGFPTTFPSTLPIPKPTASK